MFSRGTKTLLKNVIRHTDTHNRIVEESEMWRARGKQRDLSMDWGRDRGRRGDRDRGRDRKWEEDPTTHGVRSTCVQVPRAHMDREQPSQSFSGREENQSTYWRRQLMKAEEADPDRWGHSGYKELYPEDCRSPDSERGHDRHGNYQRSWRDPSPKPRKSHAYERKKHKKKSKKSKKHKKRNYYSSESEEDERHRRKRNDIKSQIHKMDKSKKDADSSGKDLKRKPKIVEIGKPDVMWVEKTRYVDPKIRKRDQDRKNRLALFQKNTQESKFDISHKSSGAVNEQDDKSNDKESQVKIKESYEKKAESDLKRKEGQFEKDEEKMSHNESVEVKDPKSLSKGKERTSKHGIKTADMEKKTEKKENIKGKRQVKAKLKESSSETSSESSSESTSSSESSDKRKRKRPESESRSESESTSESDSEESDSDSDTSPKRKKKKVKNGHSVPKISPTKRNKPQKGKRRKSTSSSSSETSSSSSESD